MWILTRNEHEVLNKDGDWGYWQYGDSEEWRLFESFDSARAHAESEKVNDFTRPLSLDCVYEERVKDETNRNSGETARLADCQYVALPEPLEFHATKEPHFLPEFQSFIATHYVMSGGRFCGVLGYVNDSDTCMPFHSFVGDDYFLDFCSSYRRSDGTASEDDEDREGQLELTQGGETCPQR